MSDEPYRIDLAEHPQGVSARHRSAAIAARFRRLARRAPVGQRRLLQPCRQISPISRPSSTAVRCATSSRCLHAAAGRIRRRLLVRDRRPRRQCADRGARAPKASMKSSPPRSKDCSRKSPCSDLSEDGEWTDFTPHEDVDDDATDELADWLVDRLGAREAGEARRSRRTASCRTSAAGWRKWCTGPRGVSGPLHPMTVELAEPSDGASA